MLKKEQILYDVKNLSIEDYKKVESDFVETFKGQGVSLYRFGNVKHPSISDLDLVIVYEDSLTEESIATMASKARFFTNSDDIKRYIFTHDILIYPRSIFENIIFLHTFQNKTLLFGNEIKVKIPSFKEKEVLEYVHFINFTFVLLPWLSRIRFRKKISLREILLVLNSIKHSLDFYKKINVNTKSKTEEVLSILNNVRDNFDLIYKLSLEDLTELLFTSLEDVLERNIKSWIESPLIERLSYKKVTAAYSPPTLTKIPGLSILHGAAYHKYYSHTQNIYPLIHKYLYPVDNFEIKDKAYKNIIKIQITSAIKFELLYKKFKTKPLIPLMCHYCNPELTVKTKTKLLLNYMLLKLQTLI